MSGDGAPRDGKFCFGESNDTDGDENFVTNNLRPEMEPPLSNGQNSREIPMGESPLTTLVPASLEDLDTGGELVQACRSGSSDQKLAAGPVAGSGGRTHPDVGETGWLATRSERSESLTNAKEYSPQRIPVPTNEISFCCVCTRCSPATQSNAMRPMGSSTN